MKRAMVLAVSVAMALAACQEAPLTKETVNPAATQASAQQLSFGTKDEAVAALLAAAKTEDRSTLKGLFGPAAEDLISPDKVQAAKALKSFEDRAAEQLRVVDSKKDTAILYIGKEDWPFPIPLVRGKDGKWFYDTVAGKSEILARRIGADELETIDICRGYVAAQREYASTEHDHSGVLQYAPRIVSREGMQNGLYWVAGADQSASPLGPLMAQAEAEGYAPGPHTPRSGEPFHGYYFRILRAQGAAAPGGAYSYVINGNMIGGFGLIAMPAEYGVTGVMTFMVNHQGKVYEKDLGAHTADVAKKITAYNPDSSWHAVGE